MFASADLNTTVYNQSPLSLVNETETQQAQTFYDSAKKPGETGVISGTGFAQNILNQNNMTDPRYHTNYLAQEGKVISEITGQEIRREDFHNNQVPFVSRVKQNIGTHAHDTLLEKFTGSGAGIRPKKMEVQSFFDHSPNMGGHVYGSPSLTQQGFENRYYASRMRQGEKPFQDIKVGPSLNAGFGTEGSGGFQQANAQEFARAKANRTINNRLPNNPKISYSRPLNPGALPGGSRGLQAMVKKRRPERWYRNSPDKYFVTTGAVKAAKLREKVNAKATKRQNHRSYYGGLKNSQQLKPKKDPAVRKSRKNNYMNDNQRNVHHKDAWVVNDEANESGVGDYGLTSIENKPNERDVTGKRQHRLNITSDVKKMITPLTDLFRKTRKENFIGNNRPEGNMKAQMPSKLTIHDPEDIARTTKKEINIHNEHDGFLKGEVRNQVWDPNDVARTTVKEMNIHNKSPYINLKPQQPNSLRVYDPEDIARTTLKEVTEDNNHMGFMQYPEDTAPGGYVSTNVSMRNTHKQFISDYYYTGVPDGEVGKGGGRGYLAAKYKAKNTDKQFLSDYEYTGSAGFYQPREVSYADKYNARLNPNKEEVARGRAPTDQREKLNAGGDLVNIIHRKLDGDRVNIREPSETHVYQAPPQKNRCGLTTVKQKLPEEVQRSRMEPEMLDAFRQNPYTQSLMSAA